MSYWHPIRFSEKHHRRVSTSDLVVLLFNTWRGANDREFSKKVGWNDANKTIAKFVRDLNHQVILKIPDLESGLYMCNLLDEAGGFWHPENLSFQEFLKHVLGSGEELDRVYNYLKEGKKK